MEVDDRHDKEPIMRVENRLKYPPSLVFLLTGILKSIPVTRASGNLAAVKVCLDPGHGGSDPGAVNENVAPLDGRGESDINLDVSYGLKYLLENAGAEVVMT